MSQCKNNDLANKFGLDGGDLMGMSTLAVEIWSLPSPGYRRKKTGPKAGFFQLAN